MNEKFFALPKEKQQAIINAGYKVFSRNSYKIYFDLFFYQKWVTYIYNAENFDVIHRHMYRKENQLVLQSRNVYKS